LEEFEHVEIQLSDKWCESMKEYFSKKLRSDLLNHCVKFQLQKSNLYGENGITNNISEGMNTLIKKCVSWSKIPMDSVVLALHHLQRYKFNEVIRGRLQVGSFKLKSIHMDHILDPENYVMPQDICEPDNIIEFIKNGKIKSDYLDTDDLNTCNSPTKNATIIDDKNSENLEVPHFTSQRAMALEVIKQKRILHVPEMGSWVVEGSSGDKYAVTLFPKPKCQCVAINKCYHILAAEMSVGIEDRTEKRVLNLTELRLNSRKRQNRIAGKKRPRPIDRYDAMQCEVNPAPDSKQSKRDEKNQIDSDINTKQDVNQNISCLNLNDISIIPDVQTSTPAISQPVKSILKLKDPRISKIPQCKPLRFHTDSIRNDICDNNEGRSSADILKAEDPQRCNNDSIINDFCENSAETSNINILKSEESTIMYGLDQTRNSWRSNTTNTIIIDDLDLELNTDSKCGRDWICFKGYSMKISDKFDISYNKKLTDRVINYSQKLLNDQFSSVNGFQDCCYVPVQTDNEWRYSLRMRSQVPPICQIHHTGRDHWITSVQCDADDPVIIFDSSISKPYVITESLKMQLFTIYGKNTNHLQIDVPQIQQQTNGVDCGIFAIANAVEFCLNSFLGTTQLEFDKNVMRSHLIECLLQNKLQEFPKNRKKLSLKSNVNVEKQIVHIFRK
jgi:hypothetical protein